MRIDIVVEKEKRETYAGLAVVTVHIVEFLSLHTVCTFKCEVSSCDMHGPALTQLRLCSCVNYRMLYYLPADLICVPVSKLLLLLACFSQFFNGILLA